MLLVRPFLLCPFSVVQVSVEFVHVSLFSPATVVSKAVEDENT